MPDHANGNRAEIEVATLNGNVVLRDTISSDDYNIDVKDWRTGIYFVSVKFSRKVFSTSFLVK